MSYLPQIKEIRKKKLNNCTKCGKIKEEDDVTWITVNGNHIPIGKGEDKQDAVDKFFNKKMSKSTDNIKATSDSLHKSIQNKQLSVSDKLEKAKINQDDKDRIMSPFGRSTDPNSSYGATEINKSWDNAIEKDTSLKSEKENLINYEKSVNSTIKDKYDKSDSLWRGTSDREIDHIIKTDRVEPYGYQSVSMTLDKDAGMGFGKNASDTDGVTIEFDKNKLETHSDGMYRAEPEIVKYSVFHDHVGTSEEKGGTYPISYADEMEVRTNPFTKAKDSIKSITIHKSEFMSKSETDSLFIKYSNAFPKSKILIND